MEEWTVWLMTVVVGWVLGFTSAYFAAKGKNLATREDIGKIEREVQRVRDEFAKSREERAQENRLMLKRLGFKHQLRLAALERRLQSHQEAYTLWWDLMTKVHSTEVYETAAACQAWWVRNNLYLGEEARAAFAAAWPAANGYLRLMDARAEKPVLEAQWRTIERCGEVLARAVNLPPVRLDAGPEVGSAST